MAWGRKVIGTREKGRSRFPGFLVLLLALACWELAARWKAVDEHYFPSIFHIGACLFDPSVLSDLARQMSISSKRILLGFGGGVAAGYILGFVCGYGREKVLPWVGLTIEYLRPVPSLAVIPVAILFLGLGDSLNVCVITWACSWPVYVNVMEAVSSADPVLLNTARTLGLNRRAVILRVLVPFSLPSLFAGMKISLGIAVSVAAITEMVASGTGLGSFILEASQSFRVPEMYAGIAGLALLGWFFNRLLCCVEGWTIGWHHSVSGT